MREDQVVRPDGKNGIYGVVEGNAATGVIAATDDDRIYLVGQYRYPIDAYSWEIIEGGAAEGETPLAAARRELREEAGLIAGSWQQLGSPIYLSNCFSNEQATIFLATDLSQVDAEPEGTEVLTVRLVPFADALRMVEEGEIQDAITVIALQRLALRRLQSAPRREAFE